MIPNAFEGKLLKPGSSIEESALWPDEEYPPTPLLLEYAGTDGSGWGHNRSNDIYVLWRYDRGRFIEIARCISQGADWVATLRPLALAEIGRERAPVDAHAAAAISERLLGVLDLELERLSEAEKVLLMNLIYQEFSARAAAFA